MLNFQFLNQHSNTSEVVNNISQVIINIILYIKRKENRCIYIYIYKYFRPYNSIHYMYIDIIL